MHRDSHPQAGWQLPVWNGLTIRDDDADILIGKLGAIRAASPACRPIGIGSTLPHRVALIRVTVRDDEWRT